MKVHHCTIILLALGIPAAWPEEAKVPAAAGLVAAAGAGEAEAQFQQARALLRGEGVPKDDKKAFELMKSAAALGHADATGGVGFFYSVGVAVAKDDKQAAEWFRKGANLGSAKAQLNLGKMLLAGNPAAAEGGEVSADKLREEGLRWIKKAADQKLVEAALAYGSLRYFGEQGVEKKPEEAAVYFRIAADQGQADAQNFLGVMCENGFGLPVDIAEAARWYRKAAVQGVIKAQANLGRVLGPLSDNKETRIEALAWLMIAQSQGEVTAERELGDSAAALAEGDLPAARAKTAELRKQIRSKE